MLIEKSTASLFAETGEPLKVRIPNIATQAIEYKRAKSNAWQSSLGKAFSEFTFCEDKSKEKSN